jgi:hypothetical protein
MAQMCLRVHPDKTRLVYCQDGERRGIVLPVRGDPLLQRVSTYLRRRAQRQYERLRTYKRFQRWWSELLQRAPAYSSAGR